MAWNEERAKKRVDANDFADEDINVSDLSKTMDFAKLGTKDVRRANGAHIYADVSNFHLAVGDAGNDKAKQKKLIRAASVLRRVQGELLKSSDIVGSDEIGKIQLQAARLHALCYKPYADDAKRARHSVVMGVTLNTYVKQVFNDVFSEVRDFHSAIGVSAGKSLIANIGYNGDRERISLGTPANLAAKVLGGNNTIAITQEVYDLLHADLKAHFVKSDDVAGSKTYRATGLTWDKYPDLAETLDVKWDADKWKKSTESHRDALPLSDMEVSWAEVKIDPSGLTERNSRRAEATILYADLDGFTKHVQEAEEDEEIISLVRELHMVRHEFHAVLKEDYPGVVLQHQGDRVFAILNVPTGENDKDHTKRCQEGLDSAIGVQSSMKHVLKAKLGKRDDLTVAIGVESGIVLVSRLGPKGKREVVCLGPEVTKAEALQLRSAGKQIRISEAIYTEIEREAVKDEFTKSGNAYLSTELTFPKIEEIEAEEAAKSGAVGAVVQGSNIIVRPSSTPQSKPWLCG